MATVETPSKKRSTEPRARNVLLALGWYYPEIHRGVARYARDHHWHVTLDFDDPVPRHWNGDGVLTLLGARETIWRQLRRLPVPIIDLAESRPSIPLPRVTMDNAAIGRLAAHHFLDRGYRHFAFIHRWNFGASRARRDAFRTEVEHAGFTCDVLSWQKEREKRPDNRAERHRWLMRRLERLPKPLAAFAMRDIEAVEVIEACVAAGIAVPDDVAVLGVDNMETVCDCLQVPLSSIDVNLERLGYEAAALLDRLMDGEKAPSTPVYIAPAGVVERRSSDHRAVNHPQVAAALKYINEHAHEALSMTDIVRHVAMSRSGLEKAFRDHYIRAPMQELRHVRLQHAQRLLRETSHKLATIARQTGFQTPHNLCRTFRQQLGETPREYRLRWQNQGE